MIRSEEKLSRKLLIKVIEHFKKIFTNKDSMILFHLQEALREFDNIYK